MKVRYIGRGFRERHKVGLRELSRGTNIRAASLVDIEHDRRPVDTDMLERVIAFFHERGIPCRIADLVEEVEEDTLAPSMTEVAS